MGRSLDTPLGKAVDSVGMTFRQLAEKMGVKYHTLMYSIRHGAYSIEELHAITHYTGKSFEDLFPSPFRVNPKRIELNLATAVEKARVQKAPKKKRETVKSPASPSPDPIPPFIPIEDQKTQQAPPATGFVVEDIYDGGLPPTS